MKDNEMERYKYKKIPTKYMIAVKEFEKILDDTQKKLVSAPPFKDCLSYTQIKNKREEKIMKVIFNAPATVVIWEDGTKTVVKTSKDDVFNPEMGFLKAYFEKKEGMSKTKTRKFFNSIIPQPEIIESEGKEH